VIVEHFFSYIMERISSILMRWWLWCPLRTKPRCRVGFLLYKLTETTVWG